MSTKINIAATVAAMTVLITPMLASAMSAANRNLPLPRGVHTPVVVAPDGRVLGTDPSPAVRFELSRDHSRGR